MALSWRQIYDFCRVNICMHLRVEARDAEWMPGLCTHLRWGVLYIHCSLHSVLELSLNYEGDARLVLRPHGSRVGHASELEVDHIPIHALSWSELLPRLYSQPCSKGPCEDLNSLLTQFKGLNWAHCRFFWILFLFIYFGGVGLHWCVWSAL